MPCTSRDTPPAWRSPEFGLVFKSVVGSGAFAMPYALRQAGILGGSLVVLTIATFSVETTKQLVKCAVTATSALEARNQKVERSDVGFTQVAEIAFGRFAWIVSVSIFLAQFCAVATFFVFFVATLSPMFSYLFYGEDKDGPHRMMIQNFTLLAMVVIQVFLAMAPDPSFLQNTSKIGNILFLISLAFVVVFSAFHQPPRLENIEFVQDLHGAMVAFGVTCFTLAAPAEALGIYSTASNKGRKKFEAIVQTAYIVAITLYLFVGIYAYACFGSNTEQIIFTNLTASHNFLGYVIMSAMCVMLCCNYPLSLFPVHQLIEQTFGLVSDDYVSGLGFRVVKIHRNSQMNPTEHSKLIQASLDSQESQSSSESEREGSSDLTHSQRISRATLVIATGLLAWTAGSNYAVISTLGGAFTAVIAFILPPVMNMKLHGGWQAQPWYRLILNFSIIALGCYGGAQSLVDGVQGLIHPQRGNS